MSSERSEPEPRVLGRAYRVVGRVQGVGFRWWVRGRASQLGIRGSVRNREDGSVEVRAHGSAQALRALREDLGHGPPGAVVASVTEQPLDDPPPPVPFAILP